MRCCEEDLRRDLKRAKVNRPSRLRTHVSFVSDVSEYEIDYRDAISLHGLSNCRVCAIA